MDKDRVLELARQAANNEAIYGRKDFTFSRNEIERFAALIEREVRGDAEPTLYQRRIKPVFDPKFPWSDWKECSKEVFNQFETQQVWGDYVYEVRRLYLHPAPAVDAEPESDSGIKWDASAPITLDSVWPKPEGSLKIDPKVAAADCHTTFIGNNATEVLRISAEGIWANPDVPVDEIAHVVLSVLDNQIKTMVKNAVDAARMEAGL